MLNYTDKRKLYENYGIQDEVQGTAFGTFYKYNRKGWMVLINKGVMQAFSLYYPNNITTGIKINESKYNITLEENSTPTTNDSEFKNFKSDNPDYKDIQKMIAN